MTFTTPSAVALLLLALGTFRLTRFAGWDDFPPMLRLRILVTGQRLTDQGTVEIVHPRPQWIDDLVSCPWCIGFWVSIVVALAWWAWPTATLAVCLPLALSSVVGLVARHGDP